MTYDITPNQAKTTHAIAMTTPTTYDFDFTWFYNLVKISMVSGVAVSLITVIFSI